MSKSSYVDGGHEGRIELGVQSILLLSDASGKESYKFLNGRRIYAVKSHNLIGYVGSPVSRGCYSFDEISCTYSTLEVGHKPTVSSCRIVQVFHISGYVVQVRGLHVAFCGCWCWCFSFCL